MSTTHAPHDVRDTVREQYGGIAQSGGGCAPGCCFTPDMSSRVGYSEAEQAAVPDGANLGLGCGNPHAMAAIEPGETVLDLGCGAGFDVFLAAGRVGAGGRVIGIDMTSEMLAKARDNARTGGYTNVEFRLGEIENLPVEERTVDAILSNCVINLSPEKRRVFAEAFRVLKPGGRLAIADVVATTPLPPELAESAAALTGCVAGAATVAEIEAHLADVGFEDVRVVVDESSREAIAGWFPGSGAEEYVASARIEARRPAEACCTPSCCS